MAPLSAALSKQYQGKDLFQTALWASVAVPVISTLYTSTDGLQNMFMHNKPHPNKHMLSFQSFYPFYLKEHSDSTNRMLHFTGTSIIIMSCLLFSPRTLVALALTLPLALIIFFSTVSLAHGFVEMAGVFVSFLCLNRIVCGNFRGALAVMLVGYGFAWFGHFFYEHNKPATFTYPAFSLMGDFYMWYQLATRVINF